MTTTQLDDLRAPPGVTAAGPTMNGAVTPLIDRTYPLAATAAAIRRLLDGSATGTIVIHLSARTVQAPASRRPV